MVTTHLECGKTVAGGNVAVVSHLEAGECSYEPPEGLTSAECWVVMGLCKIEGITVEVCGTITNSSLPRQIICYFPEEYKR